MIVTNDDVFNVDQLYGDNPRVLYGTAIPDVTKPTWGSRRKQGSIYIRQIAANHCQEWVRVGYSASSWDWVCKGGWILARLSVADFTDGGATLGTLVLTPQYPAGAIADVGTCRDVVGWAGDVSAALTVGEATNPDVDRYMTGTPSVFATASFINFGVPSGIRHHTAAQAITAYVTTATDFTLCKTNAAGRATLVLPYHF